jgi:hypothetical protein
MPSSSPPAGASSAERPEPGELLEARLREVEATASPVDFDRVAWFWMILLGIALPLALIVYGWYATAGHG